MASAEKPPMEELGNICDNAPVWPGDTISHATALECVKLGWARRNIFGEFVPTEHGKRVLAHHRGGFDA